MNIQRLIHEDRGTILPIALVLLLLLTMIGIAATMTSEVEIRIAGNELSYKQNLYYAEGSAMTGVQTTLFRSLSRLHASPSTKPLAAKYF